MRGSTARAWRRTACKVALQKVLLLLLCSSVREMPTTLQPRGRRQEPRGPRHLLPNFGKLRVYWVTPELTINWHLTSVFRRGAQAGWRALESESDLLRGLGGGPALTMRNNQRGQGRGGTFWEGGTAWAKALWGNPGRQLGLGQAARAGGQGFPFADCEAGLGETSPHQNIVSLVPCDKSPDLLHSRFQTKDRDNPRCQRCRGK